MSGDVSRRNGARSDGPRTAAGKARSSRNALRHGLAALLHAGTHDEGAVAARIALLLAGVPRPVPVHLQDLAREVALADIAIARVRAVAKGIRANAEQAALARMAVRAVTGVPLSTLPLGMAPGVDGRTAPASGAGPGATAEVARDRAWLAGMAEPRLVKLARYEGAAFARRRRALTALEAERERLDGSPAIDPVGQDRLVPNTPALGPQAGVTLDASREGRP